jgi:hypothetical protein
MREDWDHSGLFGGGLFLRDMAKGVHTRRFFNVPDPALLLGSYRFAPGKENARMFGPDAMATIWRLSNMYVMGDARNAWLV